MSWVVCLLIWAALGLHAFSATLKKYPDVYWITHPKHLAQTIIMAGPLVWVFWFLAKVTRGRGW